MVNSIIKNGQLLIWANAPTKETLFNSICAVLDEAADDVFISRSSLGEANEFDYKFEIEFDVYTEGLFVGDAVAENLTERLSEFTDEKEPSVNYRNQKETNT